MRPSAPSLRPISVDAQSIPLDSTPRILVSPMVKPAGKTAPGSAQGTPIADFVVLGAADDLPWRAFTGIDLTDFQSVGVRMRFGGRDFRNNDLVTTDTDSMDLFDFDTVRT